MFTELATSLLAYLDLAGMAVFAMSRALAAARARQTSMTFAFFAVITGIGGSELLVGAPVSWVHLTSIGVCLAVAFIVGAGAGSEQMIDRGACESSIRAAASR